MDIVAFPKPSRADLLITPELARRRPRPHDIADEVAAFHELSVLISTDPKAAVQRFLELSMQLCCAGSAGLSILTETDAGEPVFRWDTLVGAFAPFVGGTTPRDFSPCGMCLDAGTTILVARPARVFTYFNDAEPPIVEGLIVPLYDTGRVPLGTLWVVSHDAHQFDADDARIMEQLAVQLVLALKLLKQGYDHTRAVQTFVAEITNREITEERLRKRVAEQAALFQFTDRLYRAGSLQDVYEAALDAIVGATDCEAASILLFDNAGVMRFVAWRNLSDGYRQAVEGHSPWQPRDTDPHPIFVPDMEADGDLAALRPVLRAEGIGALTFVPVLAQGRLIGKFMAYYAAPRPFTDGEVELSLMIARQLGFGIERRRAEEQRTVLVHELNHRVKNTLATVQALATQTFRHTERSEEARDLFESRLAALSRAHDVLMSQSWEGAELGDIVHRALEAFQLPGHTIRVGGPDVRVSPRQALAFTMAAHELATNAVKYGALSGESGRVEVEWRLDRSAPSTELRLTWTEANGPPVTPPTRKGFGTRMIERYLASELSGEVAIEYRPDGLVCQIKAILG